MRLSRLRAIRSGSRSSFSTARICKTRAIYLKVKVNRSGAFGSRAQRTSTPRKSGSSYIKPFVRSRRCFLPLRRSPPSSSRLSPSRGHAVLPPKHRRHARLRENDAQPFLQADMPTACRLSQTLPTLPIADGRHRRLRVGCCRSIVPERPPQFGGQLDGDAGQVLRQTRSTVLATVGQQAGNPPQAVPTVDTPSVRWCCSADHVHCTYSGSASSSTALFQQFPCVDKWYPWQ